MTSYLTLRILLVLGPYGGQNLERYDKVHYILYLTKSVLRVTESVNKLKML